MTWGAIALDTLHPLMTSSGSKISVVFVEDHDEYRRSLEGLLNDSGEFACTSFSDAESALEDIARNRPSVVVMDINLPGMNGITCTRTIKERWPSIQVMMCTVYEDDDKIFDALKAGATGYVIKRAPIEELLDSIKQVHAGGSPMSAGIARKVVSSFRTIPLAPDEKLSERETQVIDLLADGLRMKEIADKLNLSVNTVRTHARHIYEKLQVQSRTEALNKMRGGRTGL